MWADPLQRTNPEARHLSSSRPYQVCSLLKLLLVPVLLLEREHLCLRVLRSVRLLQSAVAAALQHRVSGGGTVIAHGATTTSGERRHGGDASSVAVDAQWTPVCALARLLTLAAPPSKQRKRGRPTPLGTRIGVCSQQRGREASGTTHPPRGRARSHS